ncbi:MAG: sulfatase-like hydrolase/transferase [Proteobacteria bacterium]|nr:sulfatase-like hydrolase/transferase [Pseudomonadota bacterium]
MHKNMDSASDEASRWRLVWLIYAALCGAYFSANAIFRWLRWPIFEGHGAWGWAQPTHAQFALIFLCCATPFLVAIALPSLVVWGGALSRRGFIAGVAISLLAIVWLELDASWYRMSSRHIELNEVRIFLGENWEEHAGVRTADKLRMLKLVLFHCTCLLSLALASAWLGSRLRPRAKLLQRRYLIPGVMLLAAAWLANSIFFGSMVIRNHAQWKTLLADHPWIPNAAAKSMARLSGSGHEMAALNQALQAARPATEGGTPKNPLGDVFPAVRGRPDIVVLAIEGLNKDLAESELSAFKQLQAKAVVAHNHYATGDATHYGLLGLTHGQPMLFYGRADWPQSPFIAALNELGYATKRFGADVTVFGQVGNYTTNFSQPVAEPADDWAMLDDLKTYLHGSSGGRFALVYYAGTHWPYKHRAAYSKHQPEVPDDYDYSRWDSSNFKQEIQNRYLNTLNELDAWLGRFLGQLDLDNTVLVVTADHGEEVMEAGRISHASGMWQKQIHVPFYILVPGAAPGQTHAITSHAHLMPALLQAMGRQARNYSPLVPGSYALVAHNNHTQRPQEWVLLGPETKFFLTWDARDRIEITSVTDLQDQALNDLRAPGVTELLQVLRATQARAARDADRPAVE